MTTSLAVVAGFVIFCIPMSFIGWYDPKTKRLALAVGLWAACVAGLLLTTVAILSRGVYPASSAELYSLRHVLFGISLIAMLWLLQELSGLRQGFLFGLLTFLVAIRAVFWFATDLVWTRTVDLSGNLIYGPLRPPFGLAIGLLALIVAVRAVNRPWRSNPTRLIAIWVLIPAVILATFASGLPDSLTDYTSVLLYAMPVVVIQTQLLHESSVASRRSQTQALRNKLLAEFGANALEVGRIVPARGAVELIADTLDRRCEYFENLTGTPTSVVATGDPRPGHSTEQFVTPISAKGREVGRLVVSGDLDPDDQLFVRSVSFILTAAIGRGLMEAEARDNALHNGLTGLPNWLLLKDRVAQLLLRRQAGSVAMLCVDVVDMKAINDEFGHDAGDEVLREIAHRLTVLVEAEATVAHIAADEFAIAQIVPDKPHRDVLSAQVLAIARDPVEADGQVISFSIRAGIALSDDTTPDAEDFLRDTEMALMQAKKAAVPLVRYDKHSRAVVVAHREMVRDLRVAIRRDELFVEYQPIFELATGRTVGVECLARWRRANGELVPPSDFIPVAEAHGMIMPITRRVFTTALRQLADWQRSESAMQSLRMSLNLTPNVLEAADLVPWLSRLLRDNGISPNRVTLELTESALTTAQSQAGETIRQLHNLGLAISLDDFGTGFSTFKRLLQLPVSELKIDRAFTQGSGESNSAIISGVIRLARDSDLAVVAEGIETPEQLALLQSYGCKLGQGFLFSRPIAGDQVSTFVQSGEEALRSLNSQV